MRERGREKERGIGWSAAASQRRVVAGMGRGMEISADARNVVLPAPLAPTMATRDARHRRMLTCLSDGLGAPGYENEMSSALKITCYCCERASRQTHIVSGAVAGGGMGRWVGYPTLFRVFTPSSGPGSGRRNGRFPDRPLPAEGARPASGEERGDTDTETDSDED